MKNILSVALLVCVLLVTSVPANAKVNSGGITFFTPHLFKPPKHKPTAKPSPKPSPKPTVPTNRHEAELRRHEATLRDLLIAPERAATPKPH